MNNQFSKNVRILIAVWGMILMGVAIIYFFKNQIFHSFYALTETKLEQKVIEEKTNKKDIEVIAEGLAIPWEIVFLPDGDMLVTERSGTLKRIGKEGHMYVIEGVRHIGEGGLLGMILHPNFQNNKWIYLYFTTAVGGNFKNRVERYVLEENHFSDKKVIIDNVPGAIYHDGGRIAFGPDGYLYITTGDAGNAESAQNIHSLAGKILRLRDDGSIPADNPFGNAVYSYGHRNSQGLAWDNRDRLWAIEHGRSGILSGFDELNLIERGGNYGWPVIQGDEKRKGMTSPIAQSGPDETWAPAGMVYLNGSIFFTGLRGESLYEAKLSQERSIDSLIVNFRGIFGRLRAIQIGPDGFLYVSTSNTDDRGEPRFGDDKIIKINPQIFKD